jgi:hypothetical protein
MLRRDHLIIVPDGQALRIRERLLEFGGQPVLSHVDSFVIQMNEKKMGEEPRFSRPAARAKAAAHRCSLDVSGVAGNAEVDTGDSRTSERKRQGLDRQGDDVAIEKRLSATAGPCTSLCCMHLHRHGEE